jgi:hypothetical protein
MYNWKLLSRLSFIMRLHACIAAAFLLSSLAAVRADEAVSYNRDVRPILSDRCFACHGFDAKTRESGLRLDQRDAALAGGDSGEPAIVPGDPAASIVIDRITSNDPDVIMPPASLHKPLSAAEVAVLTRWIAEGAPYEPHWAFIQPKLPEIPAVKNEGWPRNTIDRFVLAKLEAAGISASPEADRRTLIRRVSLDLTGLPPTPEEVEAFVKDEAPDAYDKLVDRLLASPHCAERLTMPWLDAARYADSNGYQFDNDRWAWPWRDWLMRQIDSGRRFDEVIIEMLAGDLLEKPTQEQVLATSFNRNHFVNAEGGAIAEEVRFTYVLDRIETTSTTFLGLTFACAQCHDHKYDPISQKNFYQLFAFLGQVDETGGNGRGVDTWDFRFLTAEPTLSLATSEQKKELAKLSEEGAKAYEAFGGKKAEKTLNAATRTWAAGLTVEELNKLPPLIYGLVGRSRYREGFQAPMQGTKLRDHYATFGAPRDADWLPAYRAWVVAKKARMEMERAMPLVMVMRDRKEPRTIQVHERGLYSAPVGDPLEPGLPDALGGLPDDLPKNRLGLAKWIVSDANPLTARVLANRLWQELFGKGIVKTPEDFGLQGAEPTHPELLDYLAVSYRTHWDTKAILREIVTSSTYRQSSAVPRRLLEVDPENKLLARGPRFRLPAMLIRDQALAVSGLLAPKRFGPPVYPYQPPGLWVDISFAQFEYPQSHGEDLYRRSLYTFFRRTLAPPNLFDNANRQACSVKISRTNTPLQSLTLLNDPTFIEAARALALRAMHPDLRAKPRDVITKMAEFVLLRELPERELEVLEAAYDRERNHFAKHPADADAYLGIGEMPVPEGIDRVHLAALASVGQTILNLDEAMTKE